MPATVNGFIGFYQGFSTQGFGFVGTVEDTIALNLLSAIQLDDLHLQLTFDLPPAGTVLNSGSYTLTNPGGGIAASVVAVFLATPEPGEVYPTAAILTLSNELTDGSLYSITVAGLVGPLDEPLGVDSDSWVGDGTGPAVTGASGSGQSVTVSFSEPIDPATIGLPAAWSVTPLAAGAAVTVESVVVPAGNLSAVLTLLPDLTTTESYRVTAPVGITDTAGNPIGIRIADLQAPRIQETENGRRWAATSDGCSVDLGEGAFELIPWSATVDTLDLPSLVWLSLFTNARADDDDVLPDGEGDPVYRGGVWFDTFTKDKFGSRLWLLARSPINATTLLQTKGFAVEALAWMIEDGLVARVDVDVTRLDFQTVKLSVVLYKADGKTVVVDYPDLWPQLQNAA